MIAAESTLNGAHVEIRRGWVSQPVGPPHIELGTRLTQTITEPGNCRVGTAHHFPFDATCSLLAEASCRAEKY